MTKFVGLSGDDSFLGGAGKDSFDMGQGGEDTVDGGGGRDTFSFGAAFDAGDRVIGGAGSDTLVLQGDYRAGVTLAGDTISGVEQIEFTAGFVYRLTLADGNVAAGGKLDLSDNNGAKAVAVDASALVSGGGLTGILSTANTIMGGQADDFLTEQTANFTVAGDDGDDGVQASAGVTKHTRFDGGDGNDTLAFISRVIAHFQTANMRNVETVDFVGGGDVTFSNGNVAKGATLNVGLGGSEGSRVNGGAEIDGHYDITGSGAADTLIGGRGADTIMGGVGADVITGGKGADVLDGGADANADTFIYRSVAESTAKASDQITQFRPANDHIDLSAIDADKSSAGDQAFHLVTAFTHAAGELTLTYDGHTGFTSVAGDVNGDGKADIVIEVEGHLTDTAAFVL
jgi:Ca2+-binding RTX toxin-like protein